MHSDCLLCSNTPQYYCWTISK